VIYLAWLRKKCGALLLFSPSLAVTRHSYDVRSQMEWPVMRLMKDHSLLIAKLSAESASRLHSLSVKGTGLISHLQHCSAHQAAAVEKEKTVVRDE
jgi:hypothetical protein